MNSLITPSCPGFRSDNLIIILINYYKANLADLHLFANFEIMTNSNRIRFFFQHPGVTLREKNRLKIFIQRIFQREKRSLDGLNYIFCSDKELLGINQEFLGHDFFTDIVTFELSEIPGKIQGEIYISIDRVKENAKNLGVSFKSELHRVIFHGALHLCGYGDKTKGEKEEMRIKEDQYLASYFK